MHRTALKEMKKEERRGW